MWTRSRRDEAGASSVEYGLIVFAIAAMIALIVFQFGRVTTETYKGTCDSIKAKVNTTQTC